MIDEALERSEHKEERWCMVELLGIKGELLLQQGAPDATNAAEEHFLQSIDWARRQEALSWELRGATSLARLWRDQDRGDEAHDLLGNETEGGKEISSELIIARGDAAEVLEPTEAAFDDVAAFVCFLFCRISALGGRGHAGSRQGL